MNIFIYDKTWEGLLTIVFESYKMKLFPDMLLNTGEVQPLFVDTCIEVETSQEKAVKVWNRLKKKMLPQVLNMLQAVWLSEEKGNDLLIFQYIRKAIDNQFINRSDFGDPLIVEVHQLAKKVYKEKHALEQFVRFQRSKDNIYFAPVHPVYNSLPLAIPHFKDRFASQQWIIYDLKRKYGFYYDLHQVIEMTLEGEGEHLNTGRMKEDLMHEEELLFQELWKKYYKSLTIKERINLKQQKQYMPKRYWKYLTEKQ